MTAETKIPQRAVAVAFPSHALYAKHICPRITAFSLLGRWQHRSLDPASSCTPLTRPDEADYWSLLVHCIRPRGALSCTGGSRSQGGLSQTLDRGYLWNDSP